MNSLGEGVAGEWNVVSDQRNLLNNVCAGACNITKLRQTVTVGAAI